MSDEKQTPLFRAEAIRHRTRALFGDVVLAAPLSTWLVTGLLVVMLAGLVAFGVFGKVTTTTYKYEGSIYNPLAPLRIQQEHFFVRSQIGDSTYYFEVSDDLVKSLAVGDTTFLYGTEINGKQGPFPVRVQDIKKIDSFSREYPTNHLLVLRELPDKQDGFYRYAFFSSGPFLVKEQKNVPILRWVLGQKTGLPE